MNIRALALVLLWALASPLRADTATPANAPTSAEQYEQTAREIINKCSRVVVDYNFVDFHVGLDFTPLGSVGLTPRNAAILADAIAIGQPVTRQFSIGGDYRSLNLSFYNGKTLVAMAGLDFSRRDGAIVLLPRKQAQADYYLTPESTKMLLDWALKQPQIAKFPH